MHGVDGSLTVMGFQLQAFFAIVGNLGIGYLLDRVPARRLLAVQMLFLVAMILQMLFLRDTLVVAIYSALMGLAAGSFRVMDATVWARYFGRLHIGSIRGATMIGTVGGTALGTYILGLGYDLTGNYDAALYFLLTLPIIAAIASFIIKRPPVKDPLTRTLTSSLYPSPLQSGLQAGGVSTVESVDSSANVTNEVLP